LSGPGNGILLKSPRWSRPVLCLAEVPEIVAEQEAHVVPGMYVVYSRDSYFWGPIFPVREIP